MLAKTIVLEMINNFPNFFSVEELIENLKIEDSEFLKEENTELKNRPRSWEEIEQKIITEGKVI